MIAVVYGDGTVVMAVGCADKAERCIGKRFAIEGVGVAAEIKLTFIEMVWEWGLTACTLMDSWSG